MKKALRLVINVICIPIIVGIGIYFGTVASLWVEETYLGQVEAEYNGSFFYREVVLYKNFVHSTTEQVDVTIYHCKPFTAILGDTFYVVELTENVEYTGKADCDDGEYVLTANVMPNTTIRIVDKPRFENVSARFVGVDYFQVERTVAEGSIRWHVVIIFLVLGLVVLYLSSSLHELLDEILD